MQEAQGIAGYEKLKIGFPYSAFIGGNAIQVRGFGHLLKEIAKQRVCLSARLYCTNPVRDSSCESSVVAGLHEQTYTPRLKDQELARL